MTLLIFNTRISAVDQKRAILTVLTFERTESERIQNRDRYVASNGQYQTFYFQYGTGTFC